MRGRKAYPRAFPTQADLPNSPVPFPLRVPGVHEFADNASAPHLVVLFSSPRRRVKGWPEDTWPCYFDRLLSRGDFGRAFAEKLFNHYEDLAPLTKRNAVLFSGIFLNFFDEIDPSFEIKSTDCIPKNIGEAFRNWLDKRENFSAKRRRSIVGVIRAVFRALGTSTIEPDSDLTANANDDQPEIIDFPTPRTTPITILPKTILTDPQISNILKDCRNEIEEIMEKLHRGNAMIAEATPFLKNCHTEKDLRHLPTALATIDRDYGGVLPSHSEIMKENADLAYAINRDHGGRSSVLKHLGATTDTLTPFVLTMGFRTFFNPDPLLSLRRSLCFSNHWLWGSLSWEILSGELSDEGQEKLRERLNAGEDPITARRQVLMTFKGRSSSMVSRSFRPSNEWDNPAKLLGQLNELTQRWRPRVSKEDADHVFLSVPLRTKGDLRGPPKIFWSANGESADIKWFNSLKNFRNRHKHPHYTLTTFRITGTDLVYEMTDGNVESARVALNQKRSSTTRNNYETASNTKRDGDRLAAMTGRRVRFVKTKGRSRADHVACTPGFNCLDPYDSPILGERKGQLCAAYGRCPGCPMALGATEDPLSIAYMLRLERGYVDAASKVDMSRYSSAIAPELSILRSEWLSRASDGVLEKARDILPTLPAVPEVE